MGTPLGQQTAITPSIKLREIGNHVDLAIANVEVVPWTEFGTGAAKIGKDGKPRTQERVTAVVIDGTGVVSEGGVVRALVPEETVSVYISGHRRWEWIQAQKALDGGLQCGDVVRMRYERDEPSTGGNDKKVWSFRLRHAKPEEAQRSARCEEVRKGPGTPIGAERGPFDDEAF